MATEWNEVFADLTIASAILDRVLHHCPSGERHRLKEGKEFMKQKVQVPIPPFENASSRLPLLCLFLLPLTAGSKRDAAGTTPTKTKAPKSL